MQVYRTPTPGFLIVASARRGLKEEGQLLQARRGVEPHTITLRADTVAVRVDTITVGFASAPRTADAEQHILPCQHHYRYGRRSWRL